MIASAVPHRCRGAFAAVTAIVLIGLVASTLAALAILFAADARRTRAAAEQAQLRQLLIAGAVDVQQRLEHGQTRFDITASAPAGGTLRIATTGNANDGAVDATIVAALDQRRAAQYLRFERAGQRWKLARVNLREDVPTSVELTPR